MFAPSASSLLHVWEDQHDAHPVRRALRLLAVADPQADTAAWFDAPVGQRDAALLRLHEHLFGGRLQTTATCPNCGQRLETAFDVDEIGLPPPTAAAPAATWSLHEDGYEIDYRLPTSADLLEAIEAAHPDQSPARGLMQRCLQRVRRGEADVPSTTLPEALVDRLQSEMALRDPAADLCTAVECPHCGERWEAHFDIVSHLWSELDDWALRLLTDVHVLARAYGWSEDAILALSPSRRQWYVDMVNT